MENIKSILTNLGDFQYYAQDLRDYFTVLGELSLNKDAKIHLIDLILTATCLIYQIADIEKHQKILKLNFTSKKRKGVFAIWQPEDLHKTKQREYLANQDKLGKLKTELNQVIEQIQAKYDL